MDLQRARYLASPAGRSALAGLPPGLASLNITALATALRREFPPVEAAALGEQVMLQARAGDRFGDALSFTYSGPGLEMMTHPVVAARRAMRLAGLGLPVADLTCGIGGDLYAAATAGLRTIGIDRDPVAATLARANVPGSAIAIGDAARPPIDPAGYALILDPARREGVRRSFDPEAYSPRWDVAMDLMAGAPAAVLKTAPGVEHDRIPPEMEAEFIQMGRSLREAALWSGGDAVPGLRRAVLLPANVELRSDEPEAGPAVAEPSAFLFDPEPCATRAGLVRHLAHHLGASLMDSQVAYLTAPAWAAHPMAASFEVLHAMPFSVARLRKLLRERGWRPDEIRRRAFPVEPDELRRLLGSVEGDPVTLICTTLRGQRSVFVARRVDR